MISMFAKIRVKRGSYTKWYDKNPVLREGEIGFISSGQDEGKFKVGDGVTSWRNLPYTAARFPEDTITLTDQSASDTIPTTGTIKQLFQIVRNFLKWVISRLTALENLGDYAGAFDTVAILKAKKTSNFPNGITVNDWATVRADEDKNGAATRYMVSAINTSTGVITWSYDFTYSTDITGKQDKLNRTVGGNDNATGTVTDTGGNLSVPVPVTVVAPAASNAQITAGTRTLRATIKFLIDNIAHLFTFKVDRIQASNLDLNTLRTRGDYTGTFTNRPNSDSDNYGSCVVRETTWNSTRYVNQTFIPEGSDKDMYFRTTNSDTSWGNWKIIGTGSGGSGGGLITVARDTSLKGSGTSGDPLGVSFVPTAAIPVSGQNYTIPFKREMPAPFLDNYNIPGDYNIELSTSLISGEYGGFPSDWGTIPGSFAFLSVRPFAYPTFATRRMSQELRKDGTNKIWLRYSTSATTWTAWVEITSVTLSTPTPNRGIPAAVSSTNIATILQTIWNKLAGFEPWNGSTGSTVQSGAVPNTSWFVKFPNNFILQGGRIYCNSSNMTINFKEEMADSNYLVMAMSHQPGNAGYNDYSVYVSGKSTTTITVGTRTGNYFEYLIFGKAAS